MRFTVELLGLFILLLLVIVIITQVFVMSRTHSLQAKQLTEAVITADNAAEVGSSEEDLEALAETLGGMGNVAAVETEAAPDGSGTVRYVTYFESGEDGSSSNAVFVVCIDRKLTVSDGGSLAEDHISVYPLKGKFDSSAPIAVPEGEPLYELDTARFFGKEGQE